MTDILLCFVLAFVALLFAMSVIGVLILLDAARDISLIHGFMEEARDERRRNQRRATATNARGAR